MPRTTRHRSLWNDRGSTLVEAIVAALVFTTGLLAIADLVRIATASNVRARSSTVSGVLAAQKLEELRSLEWGADVDDALVDSPFSLERNTAGFVEHVDGRGMIVGRDVHVPPSAVYTRRWSIERLPQTGDSALLIQVLVTRAGDRVLAVQSSGARLPGDARLVTVKTRKAR